MHSILERTSMAVLSYCHKFGLSFVVIFSDHSTPLRPDAVTNIVTKFPYSPAGDRTCFVSMIWLNYPQNAHSS